LGGRSFFTSGKTLLFQSKNSVKSGGSHLALAKGGTAIELHVQTGKPPRARKVVMSLISAHNLVKTYQAEAIEVRALQGISCEIEPGAFLAFVGPSGSGKTTLLNLIGCLDKPTSGSLRVADRDVVQFERREAAAFRGENIGFIFQSFNLVPVLTAFENVEYPLVMVQDWPLAERQDRVLKALKAVGMLEQKRQFPEQLSGGQKQRVAIARALVTQPKLVLADEPTANLDHETAYMIIRLMKEMRDSFGTTFIFSTHDTRIIGEAELVYTLEDGRLVNHDERRVAGV
jgi:putative ABC transport system ATP-binding protein